MPTFRNIIFIGWIKFATCDTSKQNSSEANFHWEKTVIKKKIIKNLLWNYSANGTRLTSNSPRVIHILNYILLVIQNGAQAHVSL